MSTTIDPLAQRATCLNTYGPLDCTQAAGHLGKHGQPDSFDDEGGIDGAVTWTTEQAAERNAIVIATTEF